MSEGSNFKLGSGSLAILKLWNQGGIWGVCIFAKLRSRLLRVLMGGYVGEIISPPWSDRLLDLFESSPESSNEFH